MKPISAGLFWGLGVCMAWVSYSLPFGIEQKIWCAMIAIVCGLLGILALEPPKGAQ